MDDTDKANRPAPGLFKSLQTRADALLREFRSYQVHLRQHKKQQEVEIRAFKRGIESEVKALEKLSHVFAHPQVTAHETVEHNLQDEENSQLHALRSSNLPFYETVWDVAKSCRGVTALGKKMYFEEPKSATGQSAHDGNPITQAGGSTGLRKKGVLVDIVADDGLEWIKVSTLNEKRLLFEMAKEGWEKYGVSGDGSATDSEGDGFQEVDTRAGKLELVRLAEDLGSAAKVARIQFRHPQIKVVMPNIREGMLEDVDAFLADLRSTGAVVQCSKELENIFTGARLDLDRLMPAAANAPLTSTLNVDCTILLALISDISHLSREQLSPNPVGASQIYHKAIMNQIADEEKSPMLRDELYPLLAGRDLECTSHAAQRMREIVEIMATFTERRRAGVLLGEGQYKDQPVSILREAFGEGSLHRVPDCIQLPVKIVKVDTQQLFSPEEDPAIMNTQSCEGFPTSIAVRAKDTLCLSPINASVFLYGWFHRVTTLTSNRTVASGLMKAIHDILDSDERQGHGYDADFVGPLIHTCETARSLIGKAKFR